MTAVSPAAFRSRFPALAESVHLASCSQGALSTDLVAATNELLWSMRSHGAPWDRWVGVVEEARAAFARTIGARPGEIAVLSNASECAYQVASTQDWSRRSRIVCTDMEFPSVAHVWLGQRPRGAQVRHVAERDGWVPADDLVAAIDEETALASCPLVSYRNGARLPVAKVAARAREVGAKVFVDAYQAAGVVPIDVRELDCDYLVAGALKYLLGLPGVAFLYVRDGVHDDVAPQLTGWFGRVDPFSFDPRSLDHPADARRFEVGTPSVPSAYGAVAGMRVLAAADPAAVERHVAGLVDDLSARLVDAGEQLWMPAETSARGPMVALVDDDPNRLAGWLAQRGIVTSPRGHVLRLSFHYYNDESDVAAFCSALAEYRRG
ncbi:aminotransferase class V-fold PLP-dependent enzyme [Pseudonocardia nigra]|uniref:aminotransferase class V-fold PLP-dependent enzyme n=1 Tax=Pseudonocardia nigra TaxID=1921578 RepID=UPI001C5EBF0D|nr:aminotransferase class V-fold PLP-dependent enzyme [Pseudonocardia nigra]